MEKNELITTLAEKVMGWKWQPWSTCSKDQGWYDVENDPKDKGGFREFVGSPGFDPTESDNDCMMLIDKAIVSGIADSYMMAELFRRFYIDKIVGQDRRSQICEWLAKVTK